MFSYFLYSTLPQSPQTAFSSRNTLAAKPKTRSIRNAFEAVAFLKRFMFFPQTNSLLCTRRTDDLQSKMQWFAALVRGSGPTKYRLPAKTTTISHVTEIASGLVPCCVIRHTTCAGAVQQCCRTATVREKCLDGKKNVTAAGFHAASIKETIRWRSQFGLGKIAWQNDYELVAAHAGRCSPYSRRL